MDKLFYGMFLGGMILCFHQSAYWLLAVIRIRFHLGRNLGEITSQPDMKSYGKVSRHLQMLIAAAEAERLFGDIKCFYGICGFLTGCGLAVFHIFLPWGKTLLFSLFAGLLPYFVLQVRLHGKRVSRSKEGDVLVQELLNQYQIFDYHMLTALEKTAEKIEGAPLGKRVLLQLAKDLQNAVTKKEVEEKMETFRFSFHTAWGNILASNIFFAHLYGLRVDGAMKDLLLSMTQSRKASQYGRRENHEAKMMLQYLTPVSYALSVFFACRYFDFTIGKFFAYQLGTSLGLQWFFTMLFCYITGLLIHGYFAREKMDI